jgi:hypothetical protein
VPALVVIVGAVMIVVQERMERRANRLPDGELIVGV